LIGVHGIGGQRLGLEYRYERFGMRNSVERFFYKGEDYSTKAYREFKLFLNLFTIYYQATRTGGG